MKKYQKFIELLKNSPNYQTKPKFHLGRLWPSIFFYLSVIRIVSYCALLAKLGKFDGKKWAQGSYNILRAVENCGGSLCVEGLINLQNISGPMVFMANHMSTLENFVLPVILLNFNIKLCFVIKKELLKFPVFKHIMKNIHPIAVGRDNPREDWQLMMEESKKRINEGYSVVIFPQSTRYQDINPADFNSSATKLAIKAKIPLITVALKTDFWGTGKKTSKFKDFGTINPQKEVHFLFGRPTSINQQNEKEVLADSINFIYENFKKWQN